MPCQSSVLTTRFFIVCIHRHGMMELQLMSRNAFLLCLIKTKQNGRSCCWQRPLERRSRPVAAGPTVPLDHKARSQDKKAKPTLKHIQSSNRAYRPPTKGTTPSQTLKTQALCTPEAQLECGKERKYVTFFFTKNKPVIDIPWGEEPGCWLGDGCGGVRAAAGPGRLAAPVLGPGRHS